MGRVELGLRDLNGSVKLLDNDVKHTRLAILAAIEAQSKAD
jgi:outer membrane murein-binding lipoprotein Lpp